MRFNQKWRIAVITGGILAVLFLLVPLPMAPPGGTRMVLDHTQQIYIAPPCFEQANATNYLTETTWKEARQRGYTAEPSCTAERMKSAAVPGWQRLGSLVGYLPKAWAW